MKLRKYFKKKMLIAKLQIQLDSAMSSYIEIYSYTFVDDSIAKHNVRILLKAINKLRTL